MTDQSPQYTPPSATRRPMRKTVVIAALAALAVVIAAVSTVTIINQRNHRTALASCQTALRDYTSAMAKETKARTGASDLVKTTKKETVQDPQTLTSLTSLVASRGVKPRMTCDSGMGTTELSSVAADLVTAKKKSAAKTISYGKASAAVSKSIAAKKLTDAKSDLTKDVSSAKSTLDSSNGKVDDDSTRTALSKAIDAAKKVTSKTAKAYTDAASSLGDAVAKVEASVSAKSKADAQAKAKAEAEQEAAEASSSASSSQSSTGSTGSYGYSSTSGSGSTGTSGGTSSSTGTASGTSGHRVSPDKEQQNWNDDGTMSFCGTTDGKQFTAC